MPDYSSIVTHYDFDGLGSAALLSWAFDIEDIRFAGPITISKAEISITKDDIVSDLPYPVECGMWFDHHTGNLAELSLRGIDPATIPGRFAPAPSCVRVVYDYLLAEGDLPEDYAELAREGDIIDSFSYPDLDAWRADTPANRIDRALKASSASRKEQETFQRDVVFMMRDLSLSEIAADSTVITRAKRYAAEEEMMLDTIRKYGRVLGEAGELFLVDTTGFMNPARIDKKLIGLVHPEAKGYVEMKPVFRSGQKTQDLSVSLSLALSMQQSAHKKDMGEIVRDLNIGDGHIGASAGVWRSSSTREFQRAKEELPQKILEIWTAQG
ncbi:MAG TPA: hypothetical protein VGL38_06180 [bacterium]|jgi:hypothetical protein